MEQETEEQQPTSEQREITSEQQKTTQQVDKPTEEQQSTHNNESNSNKIIGKLFIEEKMQWRERKCILEPNGDFKAINEQNDQVIVQFNVKNSKVTVNYIKNRRFCYQILTTSDRIFLICGRTQQAINSWITAFENHGAKLIHPKDEQQQYQKFLQEIWDPKKICLGKGSCIADFKATCEYELSIRIGKKRDLKFNTKNCRYSC